MKKKNVITHKVMAHSEAFNSKPCSAIAGRIQNQIYDKKYHQEVTLDELANIAKKGISFKVGHFSGKKKIDYIDKTNSLLAIDVDNKYKKAGIEYHTDHTVEQVIALCDLYEIPVALIYTSFNHTTTRHKFRLIFQLDRTVTISEWEDCLNALHVILGVAGKDQDGICDDKVGMGHFLYGGNEVVFKDQNAILSVDWLLAKKQAKKTAVSLDNIDFAGKTEITPQSYQYIYKHCKDWGVKVKNAPNLAIPSVTTLKSGNFFANTEKTQVKTFWGAIEYAKKLPLHVFLGLETKVSCFFHEDRKPSAGFFMAEDQSWYYKCFSCGTVCDIVDFVALAYNLDKKNDFKSVVEKLIELCHIEIIKDTWIQNCHMHFFNNEMFFSKTDKYKKQYPLTSTGMIYTDSVYSLILREAKMALEYKSARDLNGAPLVSISRRYIVQRTGLNENKVKSRIQRLLNMGFVRILSDQETKALSKDLYKASIIGNEKRHTISVYAIYFLDLQMLQKSEERLKQFKLSGATVKGATARQSLAIYHGEDNTFIKSKGDTERVIRDKEILITWARKELNRKGCIVKANYLAYAKKKGYGEKYASTFIAEIVSKFKLKKVTCSNMHIKKYGLPKSMLRKTLFERIVL